LLAFLIQSTADLYHIREMTDADKVMHPQYFRTDIRTSGSGLIPKIRNRMAGHFCFKFWRWRKFALFECFYYHYNSSGNSCSYRYKTFTILNSPCGSTLQLGARQNLLCLFIIVLNPKSNDIKTYNQHNKFVN